MPKKSEENIKPRKISQKEFEKKVLELSSKDLTSEKIGEELRKLGIHPKDYEGKISKILGDKYINPDLKNVKEKLERVKHGIAQEMNGNQSPKRLRVLKETREQLLNKYYKLTQKLNDEKSIQSTG